MSRMCDDCGVPRWAECQCDPRAGMGHPDPRNFKLPHPGEDEPEGEHLRTRIGEGAVEPWVGAGADGCRRSAQVCRDEIATLDRDDPRVHELLAQAAAWEDRAAAIEARERMLQEIEP